MAAGSYQIWFTNDKGERVTGFETSAFWDHLLWFNAPKIANRIAILEMGLPLAGFNTSVLRRDSIIQFWRAPAGTNNYQFWNAYLLRYWKYKTASNGEQSLELKAPDVKELLRRRIVAHEAGSSNALKTQAADDMLKAIMRDAIADGTNPAPTAGTRVWSRVTVHPDLGAAPIITRDFAWEKLLDYGGGGILSDIAKAARIAGNEVFFEFVPTITAKSITLEFNTYLDRPGRDRTDKAVFSSANNNLLDPELEFDYLDEVTYIYAGGQGPREKRNIQQVYDAGRYNASAWNRIEDFADARNQSGGNNAVRDEGRIALDSGRGRVRIIGQPVDSPQMAFGVDWDYGDLVTIEDRGYSFPVLIRSVTLRGRGDGREDIDTGKLEAEGDI